MTKNTMRFGRICIFAAVWLSALPAAWGQVTIDVSKISCEQFTLFKVSDPDNIALWISGFHHGQKNNLIIDVHALKENARRLMRYCMLNPKVTVLQAVERSLDPNFK